jgi:hypothetical protein
MAFFPTSRNTFLTPSNMEEVGQVRNNHIYIFLVTRVSAFQKRSVIYSKSGEEAAFILPKNLEMRHIIASRHGQ